MVEGASIDIDTVEWSLHKMIAQALKKLKVVFSRRLERALLGQMPRLSTNIGLYDKVAIFDGCTNIYQERSSADWPFGQAWSVKNRLRRKDRVGYPVSVCKEREGSAIGCLTSFETAPHRLCRRIR